MDPELNEPSEPSAEDQAAMEAAFADAFNEGADESQPSAREPGTEGAVETTPAAAATTEPATPATPATQPATEPAVVDPYAGLPDAVKAALAEIPTLQNELRRTTGQVRALQSAQDRAAAAAAQAAPVEQAPRSKAREQVEDTLPEVVTTINEILDQRLKALPTPAPAAPANEPGDDRLPDEIALDEGFPEWRTIGASNDFRLWAASQPDAKILQTTQSMATFMGGITRFERHRAALTAQAQEATRQQALRQERMNASATPTRGTARRPSASQTEEDAFNAGFAGQ